MGSWTVEGHRILIRQKVLSVPYLHNEDKARVNNMCVSHNECPLSPHFCIVLETAFLLYETLDACQQVFLLT